MVDIETIRYISRAVALEQGRALRVVGVISRNHDANRAEVLLTLEGCHRASCRVMVNVNAADADRFDTEFRKVLGDALRDHLREGR